MNDVRKTPEKMSDKKIAAGELEKIEKKVEAAKNSGWFCDDIGGHHILLAGSTMVESTQYLLDSLDFTTRLLGHIKILEAKKAELADDLVNTVERCRQDREVDLEEIETLQARVNAQGKVIKLADKLATFKCERCVWGSSNISGCYRPPEVCGIKELRQVLDAIDKLSDKKDKNHE